MKSRGAPLASLFLIALTLWPVSGEAWTTALLVIQDRAYRVGVFLVVDALVENASSRRVDWAEVSVEFYNFFDELVRLEHTLVRPPTLGPSQTGSLRVATPFSDTIRKVRYRFTWRQNGEQLQSVVKRDITFRDP